MRGQLFYIWMIDITAVLFHWFIYMLLCKYLDFLKERYYDRVAGVCPQRGAVSPKRS